LAGGRTTVSQKLKKQKLNGSGRQVANYIPVAALGPSVLTFCDAGEVPGKKQFHVKPLA
jgi:hypothetical protein